MLALIIIRFSIFNSLFSWFLLELDTADTVLQVASSGQEETNIEVPIDRYESMFEDIYSK